jgi:transglutaminase-like putative cysteine protease
VLVVMQALLMIWHDARRLLLSLLLSLGLLVAAASVATNLIGGLPLALALLVAIYAATLVRRATLIERVEARGPVVEGCCPKHPPRGSSARGATAVSCLAVAVIGWLLLPPVLSGGSHGRFGAAGDGSSPGTFPPTNQTLGAVNLDMRVRGQLSDQPLVEVPADSPQLWRGAIYSSYDGTTWHRPTPLSLQRLSGDDNLRHYVPPSSWDPIPQGGSRSDGVSAYVPPFEGAIVAPGVPTDIVARNQVYSDGTGSLLLATPSSYIVDSIVATTDPTVLARATGPDPADSVWTSLPPNLPTRVSDLAQQITAGAANRNAAVVDIEHWLGSHAKYQLDSPVPKPGEDAVDDFLFRDHVGFCEQFAAAETVMLRTVHIPARLVTGLAYGGPGASQPDRRLFRAKDAHAWVEVYYPGVGWSPSDPTAGASLATGGSSLNAHIAAVFRAAEKKTGGRRGLAILLLIALVAGAYIWRWSRRRTPINAPSPARPDGLVLGAFRVMEGALSRAEPPVPARASGESAREYIARAGLVEPLAGPLSVLELECYGNKGPDFAQANRACDAFLSVAASVSS